MEVLNHLLAIIGAFALGLGLIYGIIYIGKRIPRITLKNPIKAWIRKEVVNYLNELKQE